MGPHVYTHPLSSSSSVQSPDLEGLTDASRRPGPGPGENMTISIPPTPLYRKGESGRWKLRFPFNLHPSGVLGLVVGRPAPSKVVSERGGSYRRSQAETRHR